MQYSGPGASAACLVFFLSFHRRTLLDPSTLRAIGKRITRWPENRPLILATIGSMDYAAFVWSVQYLHITVAAVLYETGPIATIFVIAWLFRKNDRYRKITPLTLALVLMSMAGFLMSVLSQSDDSGLFKSLFNWNSAAGITLVITATLLSSITAFGFRWGTELSRKLAPGEEEKSRELCFVVLAFFVASVVVAAFSTLVGIAAGESVQGPGLGISFAAGVLVGIANITWRKANLITKNLGVNAITYGTPVLSLVWLYWIAETQVARWDYLLIGAAVIIAANLLISFEGKIPARQDHRQVSETSRH